MRSNQVATFVAHVLLGVCNVVPAQSASNTGYPKLDGAGIRPCTVDDPCDVCQGSCTTSADCIGDYICWEKGRTKPGAPESQVPGCEGESLSRTNWCILDTSSQEPDSPAEVDDEDGKGQSSNEGQGEICSVDPINVQGSCSTRSSMKFTVASCGDVYGPTVVGRAAEQGFDVSSFKNKTQYSIAWDYMTTLNPDAAFFVGDNVYNDAIGNWGTGYHPFGNNLATILADASDAFLEYHGYSAGGGMAGPLLYSYLELLRDKLQDGYFDNDEFKALRSATNDGIHATWDDHDYLTNDPANPHLLRSEFRKEIEALTGWDRKFFRFGPSHKGVERAWTEELKDNKGTAFLVRFIILDEETTHLASQGCTYYYDPTVSTGFRPRLTRDSSLPCPDLGYIEDFDAPMRPFYGDDQLEWFREQLMQPADLILIVTGGPNFEIDYSYNSLSDYPGDKRKLVEVLREAGAEHIVFMAGDSHATYVTKTPNIVGYPLYTIIGSGFTEGLSYDKYIGYYGDVSHRFLVAAGSTHNNNAAANFAEVQVLFDDDGAFIRYTPHLREAVDTEDGWKTWYAQTSPFDDEPWLAQIDIRVSDLEIAKDWPRYHENPSIEHKFVAETIYLKWGNSTGPAEELNVTLTVTNAKGVPQTFPLVEGNNCGDGFFGFCKDVCGAFSYVATKVDTYAPSKVNQAICEHAGYVGDEIEWFITENDIQVADGHLILSIRNNVLVNSDGALEDLHYYSSQEAYNPVKGDSVGVNITTIINEPELYGGFRVPVKGWDGAKFDDPDVQEAYLAYEKKPESSRAGQALQAAYLAAYYPDLPQL